MAEKTELETETRQSPDEAARMLRDIADEIGSGDETTVRGNDASMTVPGTVEEIGTKPEVEHEMKGEYDQVEIGIEFEWTLIPRREDDHPESDGE